VSSVKLNGSWVHHGDALELQRNGPKRATIRDSLLCKLLNRGGPARELAGTLVNAICIPKRRCFDCGQGWQRLL